MAKKKDNTNIHLAASSAIAGASFRTMLDSSVLKRPKVALGLYGAGVGALLYGAVKSKIQTDRTRIKKGHLAAELQGLKNFGLQLGGLAAGAAGTHYGLKALVKGSKGLAEATKTATQKTAFYRAKPVNEAAKLSNMAKQKARDMAGVVFRRIRGRIVPVRGTVTRTGPKLLPPPK